MRVQTPHLDLSVTPAGLDFSFLRARARTQNPILARSRTPTLHPCRHVVSNTLKCV
jgi:hypothetical protein